MGRAGEQGRLSYARSNDDKLGLPPADILIMRAALFRTVLMLVLAGGAAGGLWWHQQTHSAAAKIDQLQAEKAVLQDVIGRMGAEKRVAQMVVRDQRRGEDGVLVTDLLFAEIGPDGAPLDARGFTVRGETVHVLAEVIKFDRGFLEAGDALRGHSLALLTGIHGGAEAPEDARPIDPPGGRPAVYAGDRPDPQMTAFEAELWQRFWDVARDPALRKDYGVRVAHGEGPWAIFEPDVLYTLTLDADGGLSLASEPVPGIFRAAAQ